MNRISTFRSRLLAKARLVGLFLKNTGADASEALSRTAADFLVADVEHAPFARHEISASAHAAVSRDMPYIVRLTHHDREGLQQAVAIGATGCIIPHVADPARLADLTEFARGKAVEWAWAGGTRAAQSAASYAALRDRLAREFVVIAQIDEVEGVETAATLAAIAGIDAIFVGRASLALRLGTENVRDKSVTDAVQRIAAATRREHRTLGMNLPDPTELETWLAAGVTLFVAGSEQALMKRAVDAHVARYRAGPA